MLPLLLQVAVPPTVAPLPTPAELDARATGLSGAAAAQAHARAAFAWLEAGDGSAAQGALDQALRQPLPGPVVAELRSMRARADALIGDAVAARVDLDLAIAAQPSDTVPRLLSAALARRTGDLDRARRDVAAARDLAPDDQIVLGEAARLSLAAGAPGEAAVAWRRVLNGTADEMAKAEARAGLTSLGPKP